jgi:transposase-like protein
VADEAKEPRARGHQGVLAARAGGPAGFLEAARAAPLAYAQLRIVRPARAPQRPQSASRGSEKTCAAATGRGALEEFGETWGSKHPPACKSRSARRRSLRGIFKRPEEIGKAIYNAVEPLDFQLGKAARGRLAFVNGGAVYKIICLAIRNASQKRAAPMRNWRMALNQFAIIFGNGRVPL